jgi:hypothetical protein
MDLPEKWIENGFAYKMFKSGFTRKRIESGFARKNGFGKLQI